MSTLSVPHQIAVCPNCKSPETRLSRETKSGDRAHADQGEFPHRCRDCGLRFFAPADPEAAAAAVRSRARQRRVKTAWKDRKHQLIQLAVFLVVLVLFLLCLRYLAHYHPDETPSLLIFLT